MIEKDKFGKLTLVERVQKRQKRPRKDGKWLCECDCGNKKVVLDHYLRTSPNASCGCIITLDDERYHKKIKDKIIKGTLKDENECWIWKGSKHKQGYGNIAYRGKPCLTHRISWIVFFGKIPLTMKVCHKCDVTSCCNPNHLFLGSQKDNVMDGIDKGRYSNRLIGKRRNKLNWNQVQEIKKLHEDGMTRKDLQSKYDVGQTCIAKILSGDSWNINWTQEL